MSGAVSAVCKGGLDERGDALRLVRRTAVVQDSLGSGHRCLLRHASHHMFVWEWGARGGIGDGHASRRQHFAGAAREQDGGGARTGSGTAHLGGLLLEGGAGLSQEGSEGGRVWRGGGSGEGGQARGHSSGAGSGVQGGGRVSCRRLGKGVSWHRVLGCGNI